MGRISSDVRSTATIGYRPGLDGVRALAVAAVILYHGNVSWAKGGFLGVDVFFVLSGYLITSLLLTELGATGRIDLVAFWSRRARRLLPALFVLLIAVALYAAVWAQPVDLGRIRGDGFASLLYVANWRFIFDGTSYFRAFQAPSPLAHTWSLAIEEQWYILWPPALLVMMRLLRGRMNLIIAAIVGLALSSATLMAVLFHAGGDPSRVYYGTDTRAQALLIGAALAALTAGSHPKIRLDRIRRRWLLQAAALVGAMTLAAMIVRIDSSGTFLYRGGFLLAAAASVFVVAAASVKGPIAAVLSIRPLRAVGAVSYGLYLWHWPVDVVLDATRTGLSGFSLFAVQVAVTSAITIASYWLIERPIRRNGLAAFRSIASTRVKNAIVPAAAIVVALALTAGTTGAVAAPNIAGFAKAQAAKRVPPDPRSSRVLMLGDSQMLSLWYYDDAQFLASGPQYAFGAILGCGVLDPGMQKDGSCETRTRVWKQQIHVFNPDLSVLLIGAWEALDFTVSGHTYVHGTPEHERELAAIASSAIRTLTARGGRIALLEVPCFGPGVAGDADAKVRSETASVENVNRALQAVANADPAHVSFVPWASAVCPGGKFASKIDGINARPDGVHFAGTPAAKLAANRLVPILRRLAVEAHATHKLPTPAAR